MKKVKKVEYRSTKLPRYIFDEAELVKAKILTEGGGRLPKEVLMPERCPICGRKMRRLDVRMRVSYYVCDKCGYKQPGLDIEAKGNDITALAAALGLGTLIGLGIAALAYLLTQPPKSEEKEEVRIK